MAVHPWTAAWADFFASLTTFRNDAARVTIQLSAAALASTGNRNYSAAPQMRETQPASYTFWYVSRLVT
ncbi:MAG: hypothetical protein M0T76_09860, partial [Desulfobacteraceae bacterium]|nr:hypothetical protein [Desulfobacteraceae bacterium]